MKHSLCYSQDSTKSELTLKKKLIISGLVVHQVSSFYLEYKWWWQKNYHPFVIYDDGGFYNYSLGADKVGHFYTSYFYFQALNEIMKYGEFSTKTRLITATVLPFTWALSIEIGDGFSSYNFSHTDLIANTLGIGYGLLQERYPKLRDYKFKFSYFPTPYNYVDASGGWAPTNDYGGHIYWLTTDINNLLPGKNKGHQPHYLNIAIGYGVAQLEPYAYTRKFAIGLDWNLDAIPCKKNGLRTLKNIVNYIHFPAPGIRFIEGQTPDFKLFLLN